MAQIIGGLYEVSEKLGSGGGGVIYLGRHTRLDMEVVLKADKRALSEKKLASLRREVETLKNLSHTYIPQVYDFVCEDETVYTVMAYIKGESFDKPLSRGEKFSSAQITKWGIQVLEALVYLHSRPPYGILHSDIKPANIMLTPEGDIRLIDFNIALALGEDGAISVGRSHGYASPEHYGIDYTPIRDTQRDTQNLTNTTNTISKETTVNEPLREANNETVLETGSETVLEASNETVLESDNETVLETYNETVLEADGETVLETEVKPETKQEPEFTISKTGQNSTFSSTTSGSKKTVVLDARSDIYSLGATLYHLLTGRRPAQTAADVIALTDKDCPVGLADIINKAMAPDKEKRYQTAEEMLFDFKNLHRNDPRAKKFRLLRNTAAAVLAFAVTAGALTLFTGLKRMESEQASLALAEASVNDYNAGDITGAVNLASQAVNLEPGLFNPPVLPEAEKALADSLGVYDLSDGFKPYQSIYLDSAPLMSSLSPDGSKAAVVYAYEVSVFDTESGELMSTVPLTESALAEARFLDNNTLICAGQNGLCAYDLSPQNGSVIKANIPLWEVKPATAIAVSSDGLTIAGVYRDENFATIYNKNGEILQTIDFGNRYQKVAANDILANPRDKLFALSADGKFLAVSFADGSLSVFNCIDTQDITDISPESDFNHYEGAFNGDLLAFSAASDEICVFAVIDIVKAEQLGSFESETPFGVTADESGIYLSLNNLAVKLDPITGEQKEIAYAEGDIKSFYTDGNYTVISTETGCAFFDGEGRKLSQYSRASLDDITLISKDYALLGGRDSQSLTVMRLESHEDVSSLYYDEIYPHTEARLNANGTRLTLFSVDGFRIYDETGALIRENTIPEPGLIIDQQFSKLSGNLAVMYKDALRIYSGENGEIIFEETGLNSVFYAPYGISILDKEGKLRLIDRDSCEDIFTADLNPSETFAAYCETVIDSEFLGGRKLIGAANTGEGYRFALSDETYCYIYDGNGKELFSVPITGEGEAFFTETAVITSPVHGTPAVYSLKNGNKITDLEKDAYLTYITPLGEYFISQYYSTTGEKYGILLNGEYKPIASLPDISDINGDLLTFDYPQGVIRQSRVYSAEELKNISKGEILK